MLTERSKLVLLNLWLNFEFVVLYFVVMIKIDTIS
jgi:hypothetical protein